MPRKSTRHDLGWAGKALLAVAVAVLVGWAASRPEAAVTRNRLAQNRLAQNRLSSNRLAQNRLAQNALSSTRLEATLATTELLATADGREVYSYIISCALPEGVTMEASVPGASNTAPPDTLHTCKDGRCAFPGSLGLADYWVDRPLPPKGQRWVTACLLARVNMHDTTEAISLRGVAPELTVSVDEAELYNVEEGAFFGNLFADGDEESTRTRAAEEVRPQANSAVLICAIVRKRTRVTRAARTAASSTAGDCADFTPEFPSPYTCRSFDSEEGTYSDCHAKPGNGQWPGLRPYREVITVYVTGE